MPPTVTPSSASIVAAAAREAASIKQGLERRILAEFALMRAKHQEAGVNVAVLDVWDMATRDFSLKLIAGKGSVAAEIFCRPYAETLRNETFGHAKAAAALLVADGFNAEAHAPNEFDNLLDTNFHQVVINIGLR